MREGETKKGRKEEWKGRDGPVMECRVGLDSAVQLMQMKLYCRVEWWL